MSLNKAEFIYQYCAKNKIFGGCKEWVVDRYDLTDEKTRQMLIHMGFSCTSSQRWQ